MGSPAAPDAGTLRDLAVVVLVYGDRHRQGPLVDALLADGVAAGSVVVVHNPSLDGTTPPALPEGIRVLSMPENVGYGAAMNAGVAATTGDVIVVCTDDTVPEPGAIGALVSHARARRGIFGPTLLRRDGTPFSFGGTFDVHGDIPRHREERDGQGLVDVEWLDGAILTCQRCVFEELGGFDERFFLYAEDVDLCARARHRGDVVAVDLDVRATTEPGAETRVEQYEYYVTRNGLLRAAGEGRRGAVATRFLREARRTAARRVKRLDGDASGRVARARASGLRDGLLGRGGPYRS